MGIRILKNKKYIKPKKKRAMTMVALLMVIVSIALLSIATIQVITTKHTEYFLGKQENASSDGIVRGRSLCYIDASGNKKQLIVFYDSKGNVISANTKNRNGCSSDGISANKFNVTLIGGAGGGAKPKIEFQREDLAIDNLVFFSDYAQMQTSYFDDDKTKISKYVDYDSMNNALITFLQNNCKIYFNINSINNGFCPSEGVQLMAGEGIRYYLMDINKAYMKKTTSSTYDASISSNKCYGTNTVVTVNGLPNSNAITKYICNAIPTTESGTNNVNSFQIKASIPLTISYLKAIISSRQSGRAGEVVTMTSKTFPTNITIGKGGNHGMGSILSQGVSGTNGENTKATIDGVETIAQGGLGGDTNNAENNIILTYKDENRKLTENKTYSGEYGEISSYSINYDLINAMPNTSRYLSFGVGGDSPSFIYRAISSDKANYCIRIKNNIYYDEICKNNDISSTDGMSIDVSSLENVINKKTINGALVVEW